MALRLRGLLLAATALVPFTALPAGANPLGAQVVGGSATVQGQGTSSVTVTQTTNSAIINWNSFNIGAGETISQAGCEVAREAEQQQARQNRSEN